MVADDTFVGRVAALPAVGAAIGVAMSSYNKLKEVSPGPLKSVIEAGEKTTNLALATSQPILEKLQGPIKYVDDLACQGLDRVEQSVPSVKDTPEKILSDVRQYGTDKMVAVRDSMMDYGNQKLQQLASSTVGSERFEEYREQLVSYAAVALTAAEGALDSHLTANGAVGLPPANAHNADLRARVEQVTAKARLCVTHHATSRFVAAQKAASDGVARVLEALSVIRVLKDNVREGRSVQEIAQTLHFDWLSGLLEEAKDKPVTQQALFVAQAAAREAQEALNRAQEGVKSKLNDTFVSVVNRAGELNTALQGASVSQLTTQVMATLTQQAQHLQTLIRQLTGLNLTQYLPELKELTPADDSTKSSSSSNIGGGGGEGEHREHHPTSDAPH